MAFEGSLSSGVNLVLRSFTGSATSTGPECDVRGDSGTKEEEEVERADLTGRGGVKNSP